MTMNSPLPLFTQRAMHSGSRRIGTHVSNVNILRACVYKQVCVRLQMFYIETSAVFAAEFDCSGFRNFSTGSVRKDG